MTRSQNLLREPDDMVMAFRKDAKRQREILRERAIQLSQPVVLADLLEESAWQIVCFRAGETTYAVPLGELRDIQRVDHLATVPCSPKFVLGLVQVHREITAVIDLVDFLGFRRSVPILQPATVVVVTSAERSLGIYCDELYDVIALSEHELIHPPATLAPIELDITRGLTADRIVVLDAPALVQHRQLTLGPS